MYKLILIAFSFAYISLHAQEELNYLTVESKSYELYQGKKWKELEHFSRTAFKSGIDYFYLRERLGIAFYEQHKYQLSTVQFEKASKFNSGDDLLNEYLFYSYLFSEQTNSALHVSQKFSDELRQKTGTKRQSPVNVILLEGGAKISNHQDIVPVLYYVTVGLGHPLGRGYSLFHAYSFVGQNFSFGKYQQHQYYLSANIPLKKGFELNPAFSFVYSKLNFTEGLPQEPAKLAFLGSLNVSKLFPYIKIDLTNSFSNFDTAYQIQHQLGTIIYPLANPKLALGGSFILFTDNLYKTAHPLFQASLHTNFPQFFALNIVYTYGRVYNFNLYNGFVVQNGYDLLKDNLTVAPVFTIKQRYSIYAVYQLEFKTERLTKTAYTSSGFSIGTKIKI